MNREGVRLTSSLRVRPQLAVETIVGQVQNASELTPKGEDKIGVSRSTLQLTVRRGEESFDLQQGRDVIWLSARSRTGKVLGAL